MWVASGNLPSEIAVMTMMLLITAVMLLITAVKGVFCLVSTYPVRVACHHLEKSLDRCQLADCILLLHVIRYTL